jgi:hypothetical protein
LGATKPAVCELFGGPSPVETVATWPALWDDPQTERGKGLRRFCLVSAFRESSVVVLVDARNVLRSRWPNVPEHELLERCCAWATEAGRRAVVVFDGRAPGDLVGERELADGCLAVGTGGESADDWLIRAAADLEQRGEPYWLVTSDRALRQAAGAAAERVIGGGSFVRELGAAGGS